MGFYPHRKYKATPLDYAVIVGALTVISALVVWAFLA